MSHLNKVQIESNRSKKERIQGSQRMKQRGGAFIYQLNLRKEVMVKIRMKCDAGQEKKINLTCIVCPRRPHNPETQFFTFRYHLLHSSLF